MRIRDRIQDAEDSLGVVGSVEQELNAIAGILVAIAKMMYNRSESAPTKESRRFS